MNKIEYVIAKEALEFLIKTVLELAEKCGIGVAHHGAVDMIGKIQKSVRLLAEGHPAEEKKLEDELKGSSEQSADNS